MSLLCLPPVSLPVSPDDSDDEQPQAQAQATHQHRAQAGRVHRSSVEARPGSGGVTGNLTQNKLAEAEDGAVITLCSDLTRWLTAWGPELVRIGVERA